VKPVAVFLSGVAIAVTGAFTRACDSGFAAQMAASWCGDPALLGTPDHAHCLGCALMAFGGIVALMAPVMMITREHVAPRRKRARVR